MGDGILIKYIGGGEEAVTIPPGVKVIGFAAFAESSIRTIAIPNTVTEIGDGAFRSCQQLGSITLPAGLTIIGSDAFAHCLRLTELSLPSSVTSIGSLAFSDCWGLTNIILPDNIEYIGGGAFSRCWDLTDITLSDSNPNYQVVDNIIFNKAKTVLVCFANKEITNYYVPGTVEKIEQYAFYGAEVKIIKVPKSVTYIGDCAFSLCYDLEKAVMEGDLDYLGGYAFEDCESLVNLTVIGDISNRLREILNGCTSPNLTIYGLSEDSAAHWIAEDNGLPFELISYITAAVITDNSLSIDIVLQADVSSSPVIFVGIYDGGSLFDILTEDVITSKTDYSFDVTGNTDKEIRVLLWDKQDLFPISDYSQIN